MMSNQPSHIVNLITFIKDHEYKNVFPNLMIISVPDVSYYRNVSCALNQIFMFLLLVKSINI